MNVFEIVKDSADIVDVAEHYGISVDRNKKALCPFHDDHNPSLSFKNRGFRCFSCGAHGDVIDFVGQMENLAPLEAAGRINQICRLNIDIDKPEPTAEIKLRMRQREQKKSFLQWENAAWHTLSDYFRLLCKWRDDYVPEQYADTLHPRFIEALTEQEYIEYVLDEIFIKGKESDKIAFYQQSRHMVKEIDRRLRKVDDVYAGGTESGDNPSGIVFSFESVAASRAAKVA